MTLSTPALRALLPLLSLGLLSCQVARSAPEAGRVRLAADLPASVSHAQKLGRISETEPIRATLTLPLRNSAMLEDLLRRLYDSSDSMYGQYLTPEEFADRFGPTEQDYAAVVSYARAQGLTITGTHTNRLLVDVSGNAGTVGAAFGVHLTQYRAANGRLFRAPDAVPSVPRALAGRLSSVVGLSSAAVWHSYKRRLPKTSVGSGPAGGLTPSDIRIAYNLNNVNLKGTGQTLALFELDGYVASDIRAYEAQFGLPNVPLQNILLDKATGKAGTDAAEATLDIELQIALAPSASKILVYETTGSKTTGSETTGNDAAVLDGYSQIAEDNQAKQISTSWGLDEQESNTKLENGTSFLRAENTIFAQMAAQGQTIYAADGDTGAYDSGDVTDGLRVDDPASQPYVCGVGGTHLETDGSGGSYASETVWNSGSAGDGASGGGISSIWPLPSWQKGAITQRSGGSTTMRNVPDVALNADPNSGYAIYTGGQWAVYGGCSCAAPLWAGFTALVNQQRIAQGLSTLGQANPTLYPILKTARYAQDFHDIIVGNNLQYSAVSGYDDATGLGTFNGANLLADLAPGFTSPPTTKVFAAGLHLFSLPSDHTGVPLDTLFGYSSVTLAVWNPTLFQYALTPTAPANQVMRGRGYWVRFPHAVTMTLPTTSPSGTFAISLSPGWNQIGAPFVDTVTIGNLQVVSGSQTYSFATAAGSAALIMPTLYQFDPDNGYVSLTSTGMLQPGFGYWIWAYRSVTLNVPHP